MYTVETTNISQLLAASGLLSSTDALNARSPKQGTPDKPTKRPFDAGKGNPKGPAGKPGGGKPPKGNKPDTDKHYDGLCNDFNGTSTGCHRDNCGYEHKCRTCGDKRHRAAKCPQRAGRR